MWDATRRSALYQVAPKLHTRAFQLEQMLGEVTRALAARQSIVTRMISRGSLHHPHSNSSRVGIVPQDCCSARRQLSKLYAQHHTTFTPSFLDVVRANAVTTPPAAWEECDMQRVLDYGGAGMRSGASRDVSQAEVDADGDEDEEAEKVAAWGGEGVT